MNVNDAKNIQDKITAADQFYKAKNYEQALNLYNELLAFHADSELYLKLGNCYDLLDKSQTALEYWQKAIDMDSMNSVAYFNIGNFHYKKNQFEKAILYWILSLIIVPEEPTTNLNLAVAYTFKRMHIETFHYYEKFLKYAQDKKSQKYIEVNEKITKNKKLGNNYLKLGIQYQLSNNYKMALDAYIKSISCCPLYSKSYLNIGSLYYMDKRYAEAVKYWRYAEILDPNYSKIISNLAVAYDLLQKYDYAYCYYQQYLSMAGLEAPNDYNKVVSRCQYLKPLVNANPHWIDKHLEQAKNSMANCDYRSAIIQLKNYSILNPDDKIKCNELSNKLNNYLHPEKSIISSNAQLGRESLAKNDFMSAKENYARILVLSESGSPEYNDAKRKLALCLQNLEL